MKLLSASILAAALLAGCGGRSNKTARYAQPSAVQTYVISPTQASFGAFVAKRRSSRFGATGSL